MAKKVYELQVDVQGTSSLGDILKQLNDMQKLKGQLEGQFDLISDKDLKRLQEFMKNYGDLVSIIADLKKQVDERIKLEEKLAKATGDQAKIIAELKFQLAEVNKENKREAILTSEKATAYQKLSTQLLRQKDQVKSLLAEKTKLSKADKQLIKDTQELDARVKKIDKTVGDHQRNVGNYSSALDLLPGSFGRAAQGAQGLGKQLTALLRHPIALIIAGIVLALYGLFQAFKSTDNGATELAAKMGQVSAVLDVARQRAAILAEGIINIFKGNWKQAAEDMRNAFAGIFEQMGNAAEAADKYVRALDKIEEAEINFISERARLSREASRLEFIAADKTLGASARLKALEEANKIRKQILQSEKDLAERTLQANIKNAAAKYNIEQLQLQQLIEANDAETFEILKHNADLKRFRNAVGDEGFRQLKEYYASLINLDDEYFKENKRLVTRIGALRKEIQDENDKRATEAAENQKKIMDDGLKTFAQISKEVADLKKKEEEKERERIRKNLLAQKDLEILEAEGTLAFIGDKRTKLRRQTEAGLLNLQLERLELEKQMELENTELTEDEKLLIIAKFQDKKLQLLAQAGEKEKMIAQEAIRDLVTELDKVSEASMAAILRRGDANLKQIDKEIAAQDKSLAAQQSRAEKGLENTLELEQEKAARLEAQRQQEQKRQERRLKVQSYYNLLSGYAKDDPKTALQKALKDIAISEGITAAFAEKGGIAGEVKDLTTMGSKTHGPGLDRLMVLDKREGILNVQQMNNLGGREGFYSLQKMLDNPLNDDVLFPKVPVFAPVIQQGNKEMIRKLDNIEKAIKEKPISTSYYDGLGDYVTETVSQAGKHILKVKSQSPRFKR